MTVLAVALVWLFSEEETDAFRLDSPGVGLFVRPLPFPSGAFSY